VSKDERKCSRPPVIRRVRADEIDKYPVDFRHKSTSVSFSAHLASYAAAGWNEANIEVASPWVSVGVGGGSSTATRTTTSEQEMWITGRWSYTMCRLSLPTVLSLDVSFKHAIDNALAEKTDDQKRSALQRAFDRWGFFFVAGVEMGGAQYITSQQKAKNEVRSLIVNLYMRANESCVGRHQNSRETHERIPRRHI
jgi:hypothetical protein